MNRWQHRNFIDHFYPRSRRRVNRDRLAVRAWWGRNEYQPLRGYAIAGPMGRLP